MKNDFEILERKYKQLNVELKLQNEELQKVTKEKTAVESQKKESQKLLNQEKVNVANLEKELLKSTEKLQSTNVLLDEYNLSTTKFRKFIIFSQSRFNVFQFYIRGEFKKFLP